MSSPFCLPNRANAKLVIYRGFYPRSRKISVISGWILATGTWDDTAPWNNTEVWNDT